MSYSPIWDASEVALVIVDYQEEMFSRIRSSDPAEIELNMKLLINSAKAFNVPIILSTVGVEMGVNRPTRESLSELLPDQKVYDRSNMNAWEDDKFRAAVKATGRKKLIFCALYTEICLTFPVVSALQEEYEVCIAADAVAGLSYVAHKMAIKRMVQAGAVPSTSLAIVTELFRDWKSDLATKARPLIVQYMHDYSELDVDLTFGSRRSQFPEGHVHQ